MNILFVTNKNVYPLIGGIERITYSVAEALTRIHGMRCFSLYTQENKFRETTEDVFIAKTCLLPLYPIEQIAELIQNKAIDVVIAQGSDNRVNNLMPTLRDAVDKCDGVKLIFVYHQMPGFELIAMDWTTLFHRVIHGKKTTAIKQILTQLLLVISPRLSRRIVEKKYKIPYTMADRVLLLSRSFIPQYNNFVQGEETHYAAIPNMVSFPLYGWREEKNKEVLLVSRMDERQKRVLTALRVWRKINQPEWKLNIVGYGEDLEYYKYLVTKWGLNNISFEGLQDPFPYYRRASIFLMTSAFEGWGLTITEAQQCGCIPIAFDSYSAVHDIIQSGRNGYIIPEGDIDAYAVRLNELMNDEQLRNTLAQNAIKDVQRFSCENVADQWKTLLESL